LVQWDQHGDLRKGHAKNAREVDRPIAGLLTDLKARGLLKDTLVLWGGEFGRTPTVEGGGNDGRDHNPEGFTVWLAGGGVKAGFRYGATDDYGWYGTGNPWFAGDVAVRGDRIVAVGRVPAGAARREIDAKGLVVAPGFIDIHSHSDFLLLEDGNAPSKIRQGVATEVLGEDSSPGPYQGKRQPPRILVRGKAERWTTLGGYFDLVERAG